VSAIAGTVPNRSIAKRSLHIGVPRCIGAWRGEHIRNPYPESMIGDKELLSPKASSLAIAGE
jgi:hypothetical protein